MDHANSHAAERHDLAPAEAPDKGGWVVVAGNRFEWSQGLEQPGNLRAREVTEMEDQLDAFLAKTPAELCWEPITEAGQVRIRDHTDLHVSPRA
jgi:hypothetical protein